MKEREREGGGEVVVGGGEIGEERETDVVCILL